MTWIGGHVTGVVAVIIGAAGLLEAQRIRDTVRPTSPSFGLVGPDGYLFAVAGALVLGGILYMAADLVRLRRPDQPKPESATHAAQQLLLSDTETPQLDDPASEGSAWRRVALLGLLLACYVYAITVLGYAASTLVFVFLAAKVSGFGSWWRAAVFAIMITALSWGLFVYEAGLPLPAGPFPMR